MRILIWTGAFPPSRGGVEAITSGLAASLIELGDEIAIVTDGSGSPPDSGDPGASPAYPVHRLPFHEALSVRDPGRIQDLTRRVRAIKARFRPDLVHVHAIHPSLFWHQRTRTDGRPTLLTMHGLGRVEFRPGTLARRTLQSSNWVTGCSRRVLERLREIEPAIADRSSCVYNGCRLPAAKPEPPSFDRPLLLAIGRLVPSKGHRLAIEAFELLARRHPAARLAIVGGGPLEAALESRVSESPAAERIRFVGPVPPDAAAAWLARAAVVLLPSRRPEGLPLLSIEAALAARPVVASAVDGLTEAVVDGETGILVPARDAGALAAGVERLLADPDGARGLGEAARRRALKLFDWDLQVERYRDLYRRLSRRPLS